MKFFFRAIWISLRYKWSIVGAILCSLAIALLWSASITTIYPFAEIVFKKQGTVLDLVDDKIEAKQTEIARIEQEILELSGESPKSQNTPEESLTNPTELQSELAGSDLTAAIAVKRTQIKYEQSQKDWLENVRPTVVKYAPDDPFTTLVIVVCWLLFATALKGVFLVISTVLVARIANRTIYDMRRIYFRKALEIDQMRVDRVGTSRLMTHLSHNMLMVSGGISVFYGKAIREPLKMITCLAVAAWISLPLLVISLVLVPLGVLVIHQLAKQMKRATQKEIGGMASIFQSLIESFGGIKTVRIFNRERTERRRFKKNANTLYRMVMRMSFFDSLIRPLTEVLGIASISVALLAGAYLVLSGETHILGVRILKTKMDTGMLMLFYAMLAGASDPARKMSEIVNIVVRGGTACENLFRTFDSQPKVTTPDDPVPVRPHTESIELRNVSFGYIPKQPVLHDVNLKIPFGQTLAIVGGNGCGKSTITNLLARFYDVTKGKILIDGVDVRKMRPKKLRQQMAWVTQDSVLFRGTLLENIKYGNFKASNDQIQYAIELAGIDRFLDQLENGLNTEIGDRGKLLSAGQRQRVALARAIVADPRILILDEATSQMDGQTEQLIHESLATFLKSRTTILITHRASSLCLADRVIVMDAGRIVGDSTPDLASGEVPEFNNLFSKSA